MDEFLLTASAKYAKSFNLLFATPVQIFMGFFFILLMGLKLNHKNMKCYYLQNDSWNFRGHLKHTGEQVQFNLTPFKLFSTLKELLSVSH